MIPPFLQQPNEVNDVKRKPRAQYIEKTLINLLRVFSVAANCFYLSNQKGLLQKTPPVMKVWLLLLFLGVVSVVHHIGSQLILLSITIGLSILSRINFVTIVRQALLYVLLFGLLVTLPASLNIFNEGTMIFRLIHFEHPHQWWIYHIPSEIGITREGLGYVLRICLKILNSVSFVLLIFSATGFENMIQGLRTLRVPHFFLLTLTLAYKYIVILSQNLFQSFQAMSLRYWLRSQSAVEKEITGGRVGFLFRKGWEQYELTYKAMIARGFNGEFKLLNENDFRPVHFGIGGVLIIIMAAVIYIDKLG